MSTDTQFCFARWLCSRGHRSGFNPIDDLSDYWKKDNNAPADANKLKDVIEYLKSRGAGDLMIHTARTAFWIYRLDNPQRKVSPSLRFEILHRDKFTCQYCGRKAPDVQLAVDHIVPFSKGGSCTSDNLTTACVECNSGKADMRLADA